MPEGQVITSAAGVKEKSPLSFRACLFLIKETWPFKVYETIKFFVTYKTVSS